MRKSNPRIEQAIKSPELQMPDAVVLRDKLDIHPKQAKETLGLVEHRDKINSDKVAESRTMCVSLTENPGSLHVV